MSVIFEFDHWVREVERELQNINGLVAKLEYLARALKERYGIAVRFVEILGKRWSHLAGWGGEYPSPHLEQVQLSEKLGMVIEANHPIPAQEMEKVTIWIKKKVLPLAAREVN